MASAGASYPAWAKSIKEVQSDLNVDISTGLSNAEVDKRREQHGYNELSKEPPTPIWKLIAEQFDDTLVKILLLSALVSFVLAYFEEHKEEGIRAYIEPLVIVLILILNAAVGVWQESNAEAALEALKDLQGETARVLRGGKVISDLPSRELVPGDVVELHVGDKVPADIRVVQLRTATVRAEQASLTGESVAVSKSTDPVGDANCELQAKENMLFSGTAIANGTVVGIVTATGMGTEIGKIQSQIQEAAKEDDDTPLKKKLNEFGEMLAQVIFWICVLVWVINYSHFMTFKTYEGTPIPDPSTIDINWSKAVYYLKIAVALAVAAIPEGLPAVITTCLALGTRTMAKKNAIVRKLPSVETLGCTTVICSDKTGTLTTNQMSVVQLSQMSDADSLKSWTVSGHTYNPNEGTVVGLPRLDAGLTAAAEVCAVCSEAHLEFKNGAFRAAGAPTEAALKVLVEKLGVPDANTAKALATKRAANPEDNPEPVSRSYGQKLPVVALLEFDRDRKSMSVICKPAAGGSNILLCKGAAECVLERCNRVMMPDGKVVPLTPAARNTILKEVERMAAGALRCLALAQNPDLTGPLAEYNGDIHHPAHKLLADPAKYSDVESSMVFVGLVGLQDPPRPEVADAIKQCRQAGIRVIVITGDNKITAEAICKKIGVFGANEDLTDKSFTGRDFVSLPIEKQIAVLRGKGGRVFSRAEPKHKQDIVRLLKDQGEVAAMTGDGVNDAPALKLADIGVAMGISGTEVAKEASDMVLADDNFSTIVAAVSEGRSIYNNMKAFIRYMISSNIGEVASIFLTAALGLPENLIPVQLLWVNLVTDGPPATALGFNKPDADIMQKPPRKSDEQLITPWVFFRYVIIGTYVGIATIGAFVSWYMFDSFLGIDLSKDGHTTVTWEQLTHWQSCPSWEGFKAGPYSAGSTIVSFAEPCDYFTVGKAKACTLALSVIVAIEMFNALNALSEDSSLFTMPPWTNPWLLVAISISIALHCVILYVPFLADIFSIVPLSWNEWLLVIAWSFPVIIIDEALKFLGRAFFGVRKIKLD
mmetsp:Transcript_20295/g.44334  ORF Transcript_20295/g.44334 Transcript_20295/m.44334 type:complete len:1049 (-) Transcript_20295:1149-4295(-)|eukprot:CAMPEP_0202902566 /NCGR_PEP_ID=MMETSP1392-20130828/16926_1 /ASSEMBLY_ACC=CAM_ASM_000868 /TAXON_ID=225041 /ORGANISM="Chlamydomonas chlamydogama, Strain SAG 11-48b" /LENGTH=1048 /DNA_ID=CAMNT_0049589347 /DNA_START=46 /DNA_END=3192 /DNA_ORIENTATION=+